MISVKLNNDIKDQYESITDFTADDKCSNCGSCCTDYLPMSSSEIKERRITLPIVNRSIDLTCPFRDEIHKKCVIYEVRPEICKSFLCNMPKDSIKRTKDMYNRKYKIVAMRKEFFGSGI